MERTQDVIVDGRLLPGHAYGDVAQALMRRFTLSRTAARELLDDGRQVVKRQVGTDAAQTYVSALNACGLVAHAVPFEPAQSSPHRARPYPTPADANRDGGYLPPAERIRQENEAVDAQIRRAATRPGVLYVKPPRTRLFTAPEWLWPVVKIVLTALVAVAAALFLLLRRTRGVWVDML